MYFYILGPWINRSQAKVIVRICLSPALVVSQETYLTKCSLIIYYVD